jgi:hypothetical protein
VLGRRLLSGRPESSIPSAMLEQEAHMFGLRDRAFPWSGIGSPQHRQMREFIRWLQNGRQRWIPKVRRILRRTTGSGHPTIPGLHRRL